MREFPEECVEIKNNKKWSFLKNKKNKTLLEDKVILRIIFLLMEVFI